MLAAAPSLFMLSMNAASADDRDRRPTRNESITTPSVKNERPWTPERMRNSRRAPQPVDPEELRERGNSGEKRSPKR